MAEEGFEALVAAEVDAALSRYRADRAAALALFLKVLDGDAKVVAARAKAAARGEPPQQIVRTKAWRQAVKKARKQLYADLRRFVRVDVDLADLACQLAALSPGADDTPLRNAVLAGHASTAERGPADSWEPLWAAWRPHLGGARRVLDVGGGVFSLGLPAPALGFASVHVLERDPGCVAALQAWSGRHPWLTAERWSLEDGLGCLEGTYDLALLLKVLPVFARQDRAHLQALAALPARRWLVSGSTEALARKQDIARRETAVLHRVLSQLDKQVVAEFRVGSELFFVAE